MEFEYIKLDKSSSEIRLLTLLPGEFQDAIKFTLRHAPLSMPNLFQKRRVSFQTLVKGLPKGWSAAETQQDQYRIIFQHEATEKTSWAHPNPNCDSQLWQPLPELPPLGFQPDYEALSYTWSRCDPPSEDAFVEYDHPRHPNLGKIMRFPIGINLVLALRTLRYPDKRRTLWVDAICINQRDEEERENQVSNMGLLYRLANRVVVWLGPDSPNSSVAISTLQYLGNQLEIGRNNVRYRSPEATETEWFRAVCPLPYDDETWQAIEDLLDRPWFERLWIWQEIQLANSRALVLCGSQQIEWQLLRRAIVCLYAKQSLHWPGLRQRIDVIDHLTKERGSSSTHLLLNISRERQCADPRDKIYGMLSIASPKWVSKIRPTYRASVEDVYKDAFLAYLQHSDRLDLLSGCDSWCSNLNGPSWVPDWSSPRPTWPLYHFMFASGVSRAEHTYIAPGILQVTGCEAAVIQTTKRIMPLDSAEIPEVLKDWEPENLQTALYPTGESLLDAYITTLRANYLGDRWCGVSAPAPTLQHWKKLYLERLSAAAEAPPDDLTKDGDIHWSFKLIRGRKFLETKDGYIGLGPPGATPGDRVCILLGCKTPMLLRPLPGKTYQVIGECYIHGLDDGIAILGPLPQNTIVKISKASSGYSATHTYLNIKTGVETHADPRLPPLDGWRMMPPRTRNLDDPALFQSFEFVDTGEMLDSDPRLLPRALEERGVKGLRKFDLC